MIKTFVKKPVQVQSIQWTGDNYEELVDFVGHVMFPHLDYPRCKWRILSMQA